MPNHPNCTSHFHIPSPSRSDAIKQQEVGNDQPAHNPTEGSYEQIQDVGDERSLLVQDPSASGSANNGTPLASTSPMTNPKMRKRTKTGCLTCRKRRIKCDEIRPICSNCIKSKRQCEGYNQRVIFKSPIGDWPNHPGVISTLHYHASMLPSQEASGCRTQATVSNPLFPPITQSSELSNEPSISLSSGVSLPLPTIDEFGPYSSSPAFLLPTTPIQQQQGVGIDQSSAGIPVAVSQIGSTSLCGDGETVSSFTYAQNEVVEYLDDDYYDLLSDDDDSAICLVTDPTSKNLGLMESIQCANRVSNIHYKGALDLYRPHYTANPMNDPHVARVFAFFIKVTGTSLSSLCMSYDNAFWTQLLPGLALNDLGLLHAILALSMLQIANLTGESTTSSFKHYAYSLKRLGRAVGREDTRLQPSTLATGLLLGVYELLAGDLTKWNTHLESALFLIRGVNATREEVRNAKFSTKDTFVDPETNTEDAPYPSEQYNHIIWSFAKHRTYNSIFLGNELTMLPGLWIDLTPRGSRKVPSLPYHDSLQLIIMRITQFAAQERKRQSATVGTDNLHRTSEPLLSNDDDGTMAPPEWSSIYDALNTFENDLPPFFRPLDNSLMPRSMSPFGPLTYFRSYDISNFWVNLRMCRILLARSGPILTAFTNAKAHALELGALVASLTQGLKSSSPNPLLQGALVDCIIPLFVAALHFQDPMHRDWTIKTLRDIAVYTGWNLPDQISVAVQHAWEKNALMGQGPPWTLRSYEPHERNSSSIFSKPTPPAFANLSSELERNTVLFDYRSSEHAVMSMPSEDLAHKAKKSGLSSRTASDIDESSWSPLDLESDSGCIMEWEMDNWKDRFIDSPGSTTGLVMVAADDSTAGRDVQLEELAIMESIRLPRYSNLPTENNEITSTHSDDASLENSILESETSMNTEGEEESALIEAERRKIVDRVMIYFHTIFRAMSPISPRGDSEANIGSSPACSTSSHARRGPDTIQRPISEECDAAITCGSSEQGPSSMPHGSISGQRPANQEVSAPLSNRLRKRPKKDSENSSDDEESGAPSKRIKREKTPTNTTKRKRKFACPYFKRNSERYIMRRSCVGPGWEEVRRVKEHVYRNHALPFFCPRCYEIFKTETLLHDHQRGEEPCKRQPREIIEGFDKYQEKQLRSRKKTQPEPNEEDKWKDMYRILFPSDDESLMPSPYLDADWEKIYQKGRPQVSNELARYEQFLRRELPPAVRQELEIAVEREFSPIEERLKSQLIDIVRDLQLQLFQSYTQSRNASRASQDERDSLPTYNAEDAGPHIASSGIVDSSGPMGSETISPEATAISIENELASFQPAPCLEDDVSNYNFDPVLFQFQSFGEFADSAYESMFSEANYAKGQYDNDMSYYYDLEHDNGAGPSGTN